MVLDWLGDIFVALTLFGCVMVLVANAGWLYQLINLFKLRRRGLALEAARLAHPLPPDDQLPDVVLQIPSFNEGAIVERSIANAMRLDWPKNKLHVQICDDSTDGTTAIARAAAQRAAEQGFDVAVIHRDDRHGFKAGALQAAMTQTGYDYFAILDIDFVSPPDFLRRCMAVLASDPKLAFVQARPDFLNAEANALTRAQRIMLDFHYCIEQAARSWAGQMLHFNGTCGIWRRSAIELAGGWRGDSLTEDWELSYYARLNGMSGTFINSVTASGELPDDFKTWAPQQQRWATGVGQVAWNMLPRVFTSRSLDAQQRWGAAFPLLMWFMTATSAWSIAFMVPALLLKPSFAALLGLTVYVVVAWVTVPVLFALMYFSSRTAGRNQSIWSFLKSFLLVPFLALYVSWLHLRAMPAIVLGRRGIFVRTPKRGSAAAS